MTRRRMTPREAWLEAAQWGSFVRSGDPGACMYGFREDGQPKSEDHRARCLDRECMPTASGRARATLRRLRDYLADAPVASDPVGPYSSLRNRHTYNNHTSE